MADITASRPASKPQHSIFGFPRASTSRRSKMRRSILTRSSIGRLSPYRAISRSKERQVWPTAGPDRATPIADLCFLGLTPQERRYIEVQRVSSCFLNYRRDGPRRRDDHFFVLHYLRLHGLWFGHCRRLPRLGHKGRPLLLFLAGLAETRGDYGNLDGLLHGIVHHRAEDDVGVFMRGLLNDRGSFVHFMQR